MAVAGWRAQIAEDELNNMTDPSPLLLLAAVSVSRANSHPYFNDHNHHTYPSECIYKSKHVNVSNNNLYLRSNDAMSHMAFALFVGSPLFVSYSSLVFKTFEKKLEQNRVYSAQEVRYKTFFASTQDLRSLK